ncbi:signal transduction histidine kinase [Zhongshania antarctica]|uniref:histidine kinase n=1 Tax=Zhongshania antarctica TaxID=641702 RepID=A0A840R4A6_9GAMM|nr:HAMP domain-containing sensor histidine kinase [Zhongshania antarctica]MBB5187221.1 signal transduction histidine kinase [Zhongshania antarctica]
MTTELRRFLVTTSFDRKLAWSLIVSTFMVGGLIVGMCVLLAVNVSNASRHEKYSVIAGLLGKMLEQGDVNALESAMDKVALDSSIAAVCAYSGASETKLLYMYQADRGGITCLPELPTLSKNDFHVVVPSARHDGLRLVLRTNNHYLSDYIHSIWWLAILMMLASALFAFGFSSWLGRQLLLPIVSLLKVIGLVRLNRDYRLRADKFADDEFGQLCDNFNDMIADVERRDQEVLSARRELELRICEVDVSNRELSGTLQRLKQTQQQLINTEKMASLGALVAGVAHEINTPIGVGVTAASTLQANTENAKARYDQGDLTQSALRLYWEQTVSATQMILGNLERAAGLIQSFKRVAVDQSNSEIRRFNLGEYLGEVMHSLYPQVRKAGLNYALECDEELIVRSYPGAISQIVTNLVMNAISHAYPNGEAGNLTLKVWASETGEISLQFNDDGRGIPAEHLARVCDPFFTTKRGSGGSGLGLHIVYNLVTQQLCGRIKIDSEVGKGSCISLFFPPDVAKVGLYESV